MTKKRGVTDQTDEYGLLKSAAKFLIMLPHAPCQIKGGVDEGYLYAFSFELEGGGIHPHAPRQIKGRVDEGHPFILSHQGRGNL